MEKRYISNFKTKYNISQNYSVHSGTEQIYYTFDEFIKLFNEKSEIMKLATLIVIKDNKLILVNMTYNHCYMSKEHMIIPSTEEEETIEKPKKKSWFRRKN